MVFGQIENLQIITPPTFSRFGGFRGLEAKISVLRVFFGNKWKKQYASFKRYGTFFPIKHFQIYVFFFKNQKLLS